MSQGKGEESILHLNRLDELDMTVKMELFLPSYFTCSPDYALFSASPDS